MAGLKKIRPVQTALCSFGMSGKVFHGPFIKTSSQFELAAVWERTKELSRTMFPEVKIYRTLEELLSDENIELVIVNTPNSTHFCHAKKALLANKHVVVEKPFTITVKEGMELKKLAEERKLVLSVYHNRRFDSDYKAIRQIIQSKKLGRIIEVEMHFDRYRAEPGKKKHKEQPGPGTGNLYDLGSHLIDQAIQLFGMPLAVFADLDIIRKHSKVDDYFELILYYPDHLRIRLHGSYLVPDRLPGYVFYGEKGSFFKPKTNIQEERLAKGIMPSAPNWGKEPLKEYGTLISYKNNKQILSRITSPVGNYGEFYQLLFNAIRNGKPAPVAPIDAIHVIQIIQCAIKSARSKKIIRIEPVE